MLCATRVFSDRTSSPRIYLYIYIIPKYNIYMYIYLVLRFPHCVLHRRMTDDYSNAQYTVAAVVHCHSIIIYDYQLLPLPIIVVVVVVHDYIARYSPYDEKYGYDNNDNTFNIIIVQYNIHYSYPFIVFFAGKSRVTGAWSFTRNITTFSSTKRVSHRDIILTYVLLYAGISKGLGAGPGKHSCQEKSDHSVHRYI